MGKEAAIILSSLAHTWDEFTVGFLPTVVATTIAGGKKNALISPSSERRRAASVRRSEDFETSECICARFTVESLIGQQRTIGRLAVAFHEAQFDVTKQTKSTKTPIAEETVIGGSNQISRIRFWTSRETGIVAGANEYLTEGRTCLALNAVHKEERA